MPRSSSRKRKPTAKVRRAVGRAGAPKSASKQQGETGRTRPPRRRRIEHVESVPEPQILASSLLPAKRILSSEARELLAKVAKGGIPLMMTRNLERIANEHGITVSPGMTPDEVIRRLRDTGDQRRGRAPKHPNLFTNIIWPDTSDSKSDE